MLRQVSGACYARHGQIDDEMDATMNLRRSTQWIVEPILCLFASQLGADTTIIPDVIYGRKHGMALTFDVFKPTTPNGAGVLFIVSGGWLSWWHSPEHAASDFRPLLDNGFTLFSIRHGSGHKYKVPEIVSDVRKSVRFIRHHAADYGVDGDRLGVYGISAGGHLALMLGTAADDGDPDAPNSVDRASSRVAAVVAFYPPTDLRSRVPSKKDTLALNFDPNRSAEFSPIVQVSPDDAPTLLLHGDQDTHVPLSDSTSIFVEFEESKVKCKLVVVKGAGHRFLGKDEIRANDEMVAWFKEHLVSTSSR